MRKVLKYISSILAVLTIYVLSSFSPIQGQTLNVFILYGEDAVTDVEACQGSTLALTIEVYGGSGTGHTYTWSGDTNPLYFNDLGDLVSYKNTTPAGTYNLTVDVEDDGGFTGTASVTVVIKPSPLATIVANGPTTFCAGNSVELEETNGQTDVTYQWQRNFSNIGSATNETYLASIGGSYRIRVTGSNGCNKTSNIIDVTVNDLPVVTLGAFADVCIDGATFALSGGSPAGGTYSGTGVSGGNFNPATAGVGTHTITYTYTDGSSCTNFATNTITVNALPIVTLGVFADVCVDDATFALSGGSPAGGTYSGTGVSGGNFNPATAGVGTHTIIYTYTDGEGCTNSDNNTIKVNALPIVTLSAFTDVCVNAASFALSGGSPLGGVYSGTGVSGGNFTPATAGVGTHTITYTYTDGNGCSNFATNTITVDVLPVVTLGAFADVCVDGASFVLSGGNPVGGTYSGTGVSGGNFNPATAGVGTHTITYTYTDGSGCSNFATNTITVNALPVVTLGAFADVCVDDATFALSGGSPAGGTYSGTGVGGGNFNPALAGVGTHTITYSYTDPSGCFNSSTNTITVNALPVVTLSAFADVCVNAASFALSGGSPLGGTYSGTGVSGGNFNPAIAGVGTHTITYSYTDGNGCSNFATNSITVDALPVVTLGVFADVCVDGSSFALSGGSPLGGTYSGTGVSGGNFNPATAGVGTHTITYTYTDGNGCMNSATNSITVNALPIVTLGTFADVCIDAATFALSGGNPAGGTYSGTGVGGGNFNSALAGVGTHTITYSYTDPSGCFNTATNTIKVNPLPIQYTVTGGGTYCFGDAGALVGLSDSETDVTYSLYLGGVPTTTIVAGTGNAISFGAQTSGTYTVYAQVDLTGCTQIMLGSVVVSQIPAIVGNTVSADQTICSGTAPAQLTGPIPTGGSGAYSYRWQRSTTAFTGPFSNITGATSQNYTPLTLTQTTYYRRVITSGACISISNVLTITVNPVISNNTISTDQTICYNTAPNQFDGTSPAGGNGAYTYVWQSSTVGVAGPFADIAGATDINYQPGNLTQDTWFRRVVTSPPCSDNTSNVVAVSVSPEFSVSSFTSTNPTCNGYSDGLATANLTGGTAPYDFSWNTVPVQTAQTAIGLSAGINYTVTVTDASLCVAVGNITLTEPAAIGLSSVTPNSVTGCFGDINGSIQIEANGGTPNYTYTLFEGVTQVGLPQTPVFPAGANFGGLAAGTYSVTVTDVNACPAHTESNIVISEPAALIVTDVQTTPISCAGYADGTITITASGGTGALEYTIDGLTYQASNIFNVGEGYYDITVRDANGCTTSWPVQIELVEPSEISFNYEITNITTCNGDNAGEISVTNVSGGSGTGYEFSIYVPEVWGSNPLFENLAGGATNPYFIKVRDSHGCIEVGNDGNAIFINQPAPITFNVVTTNVTTCWYNTNGTIKINTVGGGTGSKQVSIDGITYYPTNYTFNVGVGSYTVSVRDANGCISTKPAVITGPPAIVVDAVTITDATCFGAANGSFDATASGGTLPLEYSIDGITYQATGLFSGLTGGTHTLYVRDINGCILEQDVVVGQPPALYFTTQDAINISCNGLFDGQITLVAAGGNGSFNYSITGGAPFGNATGVFTGLSAGNYTAAVEDINGCSTIGDVLVISEPLPLAITSQLSTDIVCFGQTNGTITVEASGGTTPLVYNLIDAALNTIDSNGDGNFTGVGLGTFTVEVDDANGCGPILAGPFTINEPTELTFTFTTVDLTCFGVPTGEINITAAGGIPPYEYSFDGGTTYGAANVQSGLSGGNHTVIVRDANLCESTQIVTLNEPAQLFITLTPTNITCNGLTDGQIDVSASGGDISLPYQFRIDGSAWQAAGTFTGLSDGIYFIEVMDASGCIVGDNATITEPSAIQIDAITPVNATCTTLGSITVAASGGTGVLTYTLNPGAISNTTGVFPDLSTGDYTVDITDINSCGPVSTGTISLVSPPAIVIDDVIVNNVTGCFGDSNGSIEIQASGGTAPLNYSIDGGLTFQLSNVFSGLPVGSHVVVVNDINDCPQTSNVNITQPDELLITNTVVVQETSAGANDGSITVTATGGTGILTYTLQPSGDFNNDGIFEDLGAGTYQVVVTDESGCTEQTLDLVISGVTVTTAPTMVSCNGLSDGEILVTIVGGFPPFNVVCTRVSDSQTFPVNNVAAGQYLFENLTADIYLISITDAIPTAFPNRQVTVTQPDALVASYVNHINPTCNGVTDGTVEFNISGGTTDYTISWDGGSSVGNIATGVGAGTFIFTITDANGCITTVNDVPEITEPSAIQIIELTQFDPTCNGESIGLINVTASGGATPLTYTLTGAKDTTTTTGVFDNLPAGVYDLSITDANGCIANFDPPVRITLLEPSPIVITGLTPADPLTCPNVPEGFVRIQVDGGQPDYSFLWSNGQTTVDLENVVVGDYTVFVTDALNCKVEKTFTVAGPPMLELTTLITQAQCRIKPTGDDGRIEITGTTGGNGDFADLIFLWNDKFSTTGPIVGNISGGIYTVTITDLSSCVYTFDYEVPINPRFNYHAFAGNDTTVCYDNPVTLHGSVNGGDADLNFTYDWFEIPNTAIDPIFTGADYSVQLTESKAYLLRVTDDDLGCLDTTRINLLVYPNIGLQVPLYISAVQDTIISVLMGKEFNVDVITQSVEFETTFEWKPDIMFLPSNSWNSSIIFSDEIKRQIPADRIVTLQDPITKRRTEFILVDVIATTEKGCVDSIRLYTRIVEDLAFGNVFSPNGDGINDRWSIPKNYLFPDLEIEIFNRWGSLVWSAKGDEAAKGWNGRTNNGQELPIGTYYYIVKFNAQAHGSNWKPLTGSVTIVK